MDIPLIGQFNDVYNPTVSAKFLISKIKKESQLTESTIKNSVYFPDIEQRYNYLSVAKDTQQKRKCLILSRIKLDRWIESTYNVYKKRKKMRSKNG